MPLVMVVWMDPSTGRRHVVGLLCYHDYLGHSFAYVEDLPEGFERFRGMRDDVTHSLGMFDAFVESGLSLSTLLTSGERNGISFKLLPSRLTDEWPSG